MAKRSPIEFLVERTSYGWSAMEGPEHLGLFVKQRQAVDAVQKRRAALKVKGRPSTLEVNGSEPEPVSRPFRVL